VLTAVEGKGVERAGVEVPMQTVAVTAGVVELEGTLAIPPGADGIVVFPHGGGSSRHSPRDRALGRVLLEAGIATLQLDLLTPHEIELDLSTRHLRFDVELLAGRLSSATCWLGWNEQTRRLPIGLFGTGVGTAAALITATDRPDVVTAIVSRGGRPDLAGPILCEVQAPTLFLVGGNDSVVRVLNQAAVGAMRHSRELRVIAGAGHNFEEVGALPQVGTLAADWFRRHLLRPAPVPGPMPPRADAGRRGFAHTIRRQL
jgi:putative phosphoribosyl transferase